MFDKKRFRAQQILIVFKNKNYVFEIKFKAFHQGCLCFRENRLKDEKTDHYNTKNRLLLYSDVTFTSKKN